jgi:nucleoside-triphosphatase THEP1
MTLAQEFNSLNGLIVSRKTLENLLLKAEKQKHTVISKRVIKVLQAFKDDTFLIEINNLVEPYGLNAPDKNAFEIHTNLNPKRVWEKPVIKRKKKSIEKGLDQLKKTKTTIKRQIPIKKTIAKPIQEKKIFLKPAAKKKEIVAKKTKPVAMVNVNKNSLAYKMANKPSKVDLFKIENTDISEFLGNIEQKEKESVVITLTGGQGSMKTRMCFQFMNALAQNYKTGHASIEEHPESSLYYNKAAEYLNAKALQNIEAPEIKSVSDLEKLINNNDVIVIDSFSKMQEMHKGFEVDKDLRKKYDGKLFIIIFQQTSDGKMRGGSKSQFDGDVILFTEKMSNYKENYIWADKNRYQDKPLDELKFNIFNKKLVRATPQAVPELLTTQIKKLSFTVN